MHSIPGAPRLTPREQQVLALLLLGKADKEIANKLQLELRTARFHVQNILQKHDVHSRSELLAWHLENPTSA